MSCESGSYVTALVIIMTSWRANQRGSVLDGVVVAGWASALSNFFRDNKENDKER